jgi:hypothetical protein
MQIGMWLNVSYVPFADLPISHSFAVQLGLRNTDGQGG